MPITQKELLEKEFKSEGVNLFGGLLNPGLYVLAGTSKVGKSMVATTMANCVAQGIDFFGKSMPKGKVIYFDNDNDYYGVADQQFRFSLIINSDTLDQSFRLG